MKKQEKSEQTVVVGMSGGVDSSLAALLLKEEGYRVVGLFMRNWEETDEDGQCSAEDDYADVVEVCEQIDIPYYTVDFVKEYRANVFSEFIADIEKGLTPNPDILCNSEIKFKVFYEEALRLGADFVATGHYCRVGENNGQFQLLKGIDPNKDQSYFLHAINGEVLNRVLFPVGELEKTKVRELAQKHNLFTKNKKDSTGICFIGERHFQKFLSQYIAIKPGKFKTLDGKIVGKHQGIAFYTIGQRKGLGIGGVKEDCGEGPWFVLDKDIQSNELIVGRGEMHPALYRDELWTTDLSFIQKDQLEDIKFPFKCKAKIRYRQSDQDCVIEGMDEKGLRVSFPVPQRAITLGQYIVFYLGDICLGGGVISSMGQNYWELGKSLPISLVV